MSDKLTLADVVEMRQKAAECLDDPIGIRFAKGAFLELLDIAESVLRGRETQAMREGLVSWTYPNYSVVPACPSIPEYENLSGHFEADVKTVTDPELEDLGREMLGAGRKALGIDQEPFAKRKIVIHNARPADGPSPLVSMARDVSITEAVESVSYDSIATARLKLGQDMVKFAGFRIVAENTPPTMDAPDTPHIAGR